VLWHQRGRDRAGRWLDTPVLGLYQVRDGKLARAQMFYFDPLAGCRIPSDIRQADGMAPPLGSIPALNRALISKRPS
jgi:hypothetical protein